MFYRFLVCLILVVLCECQDQCQEKVQCKPFKGLKKDDPSLFIINAAGRLGNHLMAFGIVMALAKSLKVQPYVKGETAEYLNRYFTAENIPVFEDTFCNAEEIQFEIFNGDLDEVVQRTDLHTGKVIFLWPWGYKEDSPVCCPAEDLMAYVTQTNLAEVKEALVFQPKFQKHAEKIQNEVAAQLNASLDEITFVGIHHRRTDHLDYMLDKFNEKPLKKSYFKNAMEYFRDDKETEFIAFLYVSDDMQWGLENLAKVKKKYKDLFFVGIGQEETDAIGYDMAVMASCDATIISRGSFSTWCAILSGGEYYGEYGAIVTLKDLIDQQNKVKGKKKKNKRKVY